MDWGSAGRLGAAIATGGASEVAIRVAEKYEEEKKREAQQGSGGASSSGGEDHACAGVQINSCCKYQLVPPFLLDSHTGRVWRYDDASKQLKIVGRESTKIEHAMETLMTAKLAADLTDALNDATKTSSREEHRRVSDLIDLQIEALDERIKELKK